jgi:hypothetical protein
MGAAIFEPVAGMGKLFVAAKRAQKSVGPKGGKAAAGGSPSSARRLWK